MIINSGSRSFAGAVGLTGAAITFGWSSPNIGIVWACSSAMKAPRDIRFYRDSRHLSEVVFSLENHRLRWPHYTVANRGSRAWLASITGFPELKKFVGRPFVVTSVEPPLGVDQVLARNKFDCCAPFESLRTNGEISASCLKASLERLSHDKMCAKS
jgi:hypothetical protein